MWHGRFATPATLPGSATRFPNATAWAPRCSGAAVSNSALEAMDDGAVDTLIIMENDLYRRTDAAMVDRLLAVARHIVMIDHIEHATSAKADVVLPAATFAEADGTLVNNEGRAQRFFQVFVPGNDIKDDIRGDVTGDIRESWRWVRDIIVAAGRGDDARWSSLDDVTAACARAIPNLEPILRAAPSSDFRIDGQKIPREPHRYSGRTAMHANVSIQEPEQPGDPDSPLSFSMEGYPGNPPPSLIPRVLGARLEFGTGVKQVPGRSGRPAQGRRPGRAPDRADARKKSRLFSKCTGGLRAVRVRMAAVAAAPRLWFGGVEYPRTRYRRAQSAALSSRSTPPTRVISGWQRGTRSSCA